MKTTVLSFDRAATLVLSIALALVVNLTTVSGERPARTNAVIIGIEGHCRIGCWTGVRYLGSESVSGIETRDGDGIRVQFRQLKDRKWGYVVPGSEAAPLLLHGIVQGNDGVVLSTRFPAIGTIGRRSIHHRSSSRGSTGRGMAIPRQMRWIVAFGDPLGIETIGANELLDRDATIAVSHPTGASSLPDSMLGYDGVDMMVIGGSSAELLASLTASQRDAIRDWINEGGYALLTLGQAAEQLFEAAPWLLDLLPIDQLKIVTADPSALETYTSTQTSLDSFAIAQLPKDRGEVLVMGRTTRRVSAPLAVEYGVGFGKIIVIAADLEKNLFADWPQRLDLITQLTDPILIPESQRTVTRNRMTAYDDLAGQLRSSLDRFSTRRNVGFSIVSLILIALIAAIGPLDYLLINRLLGRPLLGWVFFPLVVIGISSVLVWQARPLRVTSDDGILATNESGLESNQLEIFDIDTIAGIGRGFAARYFYSHDARSADINVSPSESLRSISGVVRTMITAPLGNPGRAFGGIPIAIEDTRLPTYRVPFRFDGRSTSTSLDGLPIASRSSKGIVTRCSFDPKLANDVTMYRRRGSELLQGELINPLPLDLLDGILIFRNWAYRLPTRFPAGGRIASVAELRQKNFRWQLSRQKALEESDTQTEPWDPAKVDSLDRIAEMLMFYRAAGGLRYTTLRNDPLAALDLSDVLSEDRCMLVGRLERPLTECDPKNFQSGKEKRIELSIGQIHSLIRVVLPVQPARRR